MSGHFSLAAAAVAAILVGAACAVYGSSLLLPADAGGTDAGSEADAPSCPLSRWPPRPAQDDPSSGDVEILTALSELHFRSPDGGGYDLDGVCTCEGMPPGPESCTPRKDSPPHCDGRGGADNSGGELLAKFEQIGNVFSENDLGGGIRSGSGGVILRVVGYNGKANDTQVTFSLYSSNGTRPDDGGSRPMPAWDGGDEWTVDTDSLVGGVAPPYVPAYFDTSAYVKDWVLVASMDFPLVVGTRSVARTYIKMKGSAITGRIVPWRGTFQLAEGVMVGRFTTRNFLTDLQAFTDPFDSKQRLCGDSGTYQVIKTQVCRAADVTSDILSDGKGAPCDALSIAFFFGALPAAFGGPDKAMPAPPPCGPAYWDDCN